MPAYCDDCGRKQGLPIGFGVPGYYGRCPQCGINRACYGGIDPSPQTPRQSSKITDWIEDRE